MFAYQFFAYLVTLWFPFALLRREVPGTEKDFLRRPRRMSATRRAELEEFEKITGVTHTEIAREQAAHFKFEEYLERERGWRDERARIYRDIVAPVLHEAGAPIPIGTRGQGHTERILALYTYGVVNVAVFVFFWLAIFFALVASVGFGKGHLAGGLLFCFASFGSALLVVAPGICLDDQCGTRRGEPELLDQIREYFGLKWFCTGESGRSEWSFRWDSMNKVGWGPHEGRRERRIELTRSLLEKMPRDILRWAAKLDPELVEIDALRVVLRVKLREDKEPLRVESWSWYRIGIRVEGHEYVLGYWRV